MTHHDLLVLKGDDDDDDDGSCNADLAMMMMRALPWPLMPTPDDSQCFCFQL